MAARCRRSWSKPFAPRGRGCPSPPASPPTTNERVTGGRGGEKDAHPPRLTEVSHYVSEVVNLVPNPFQPYVGASAFAHKGGLHTDGVVKKESSYQHAQPD